MIRISGRMAGVAQTVSAISTLPSLLQQAGEAAMTESLQLVSRTIRDKYLVGPFPQEIERRSGRFRATWQRGDRDNLWQIRSEGNRIEGAIGSKDMRARILNDGGVIRPTRSQYLAIRTEFTKTSRGVVKEQYRGPLRQVPNTFVIRSKHGQLSVWQRLGSTRARGRRLSEIAIPIAWLVRQVTIRGRHFREKTETTVQPLIPAIFTQRFQTLIDRVNATLGRHR